MAVCGTAASDAAVVFTLKKNGSSIGTLTFAIGSHSGGILRYGNHWKRSLMGAHNLDM